MKAPSLLVLVAAVLAIAGGVDALHASKPHGAVMTAQRGRGHHLEAQHGNLRTAAQHGRGGHHHGHHLEAAHAAKQNAHMEAHKQQGVPGGYGRQNYGDRNVLAMAANHHHAH